jgi:hypothetical protein
MTGFHGKTRAGSYHVLICNLQFDVMGYKALHGITYFLGCHVEILLSAVVTGSWHIFMGAVSVAKELNNKMFMSAHVNDIRLQPLYTWQPKIWMLHALTRYTKFAVIYKKPNTWCVPKSDIYSDKPFWILCSADWQLHVSRHLCRLFFAAAAYLYYWLFFAPLAT